MYLGSQGRVCREDVGVVCFKVLFTHLQVSDKVTEVDSVLKIY